jgi:cytoplasmic iron level regulating protein YaaA (DUF328/UPF0246 family)
MLLLISPAKSLDFTPPVASLPASLPRLHPETIILAKRAKGLTKAKLRALMSISDSLAALNRERFQAFDRAPDAPGLQAALAFNGDVYLGLEARNMTPEDLAFAQEHLRILSGLYGLLRPLDRIQPYRLEMGVRLNTRRGADLYEFWGGRIAKLLRADSEGHPDPTVINLASQEYSAAVDRKALKRPLIDIRFLEQKDGQSRMLGFFAKRARGLMARWAIINRIDRAEDLKGFDVAGYRFDPAASTATEWAFCRPQP